jgi:iron complex outermembrane receptor protein
MTGHGRARDAALVAFATMLAFTDTASSQGAEPAAARPQGLEEIVVTARRVEENIQDVPVSVTSIDAGTIEQTMTMNVGDLQFLVPNLSTRPGPAQPTALIVAIRGQVQEDILATLDPSVGIYEDGIYIARPHGANVSLFDVHSVQVLRGPQGTLFGRNTTGGAVLLTTNDPDPGGVSGMLGGELGSFDKGRVTGVLNVPLLKDVLAVRVAGERLRSHGWGFDETNRRDIATDHTDDVRAKLLFQPTDKLRFVFGGEWIDIDQLGLPVKAVHALTLGEVLASGATPGVCCLASLIAPNYNSFAGGDPYRVNFDPGLFPRAVARVGGLTLNGSWDLPWLTAKFIGGVRQNQKVSSRLDIDGSPTKIVDSTQFSDDEEWISELQLTGTLFNGSLQWVAGGTYFEENGSDNGHTPAFDPFVGPPDNLVVIETRGKVHNTGQGLFLQANYALTERWGVTGGVRYSLDEKKLVLRATTSGIVCSIPQNMRDSPGECQGTFDKDFDNLSYLASTQYRVIEKGSVFDEMNVYASLTTGYRSGGQNLRGADARTLKPFNPETLMQYELGVKSELFDRRVRLNGAGYYTLYDDIQRSTIIAVNGVPATVVENAAKAHISGAEIELSALPLRGLVLGATFGLTLPRYDKFVDSTGRDRSHEKFDFIPEKTLSLSAAYTMDVFGAEWMNRVDYAWQAQLPDQQGAIPYFRDRGFDPTPYVTVPANDWLNVRSAVRIADRLELGVFGRNLTDSLQRSSLALGQGPDFISTIANNPGRQWGADVRFEF